MRLKLQPPAASYRIHDFLELLQVLIPWLQLIAIHILSKKLYPGSAQCMYVYNISTHHIYVYIHIYIYKYTLYICIYILIRQMPGLCPEPQQQQATHHHHHQTLIEDLQ